MGMKVVSSYLREMQEQMESVAVSVSCVSAGEDLREIDVGKAQRKPANETKKVYR